MYVFTYLFIAVSQSQGVTMAKLIQNCFLRVAGIQSCFSRGQEETKHRKNKEKERQKMYFLFLVPQISKDFCYSKQFKKQAFAKCQFPELGERRLSGEAR